MAFSRFGVQLSLRLCVVLAALGALAYLLATPGFYAARMLVSLVVVATVFELMRYVRRTNRELARFFDAARYADFGQRFDSGAQGSGFDELGAVFSEILGRFRDYRASQETELKHLKALVEHVPVPLISVHGDGRVELWNNAARRLFGNVNVTALTDLDQFGPDLGAQIASANFGDKKLVTFTGDESERSLSMAVSQIVIDGRAERLISLQDIQSELDGMQVGAWQDLVRVLRHEIMNSITPVASLARTAVDLVDDVERRVDGPPDLKAEIGDLRDAVNTVANRSDGLMNFVSSYRQLTRLPPPNRVQFAVRELFDAVRTLVTGDWEERGLTLTTRVEPPNLELLADREMIEQVLINMVQNSAQALAERERGEVELNARLNRRGRVTIEVADDGPGIPEEIRSRVFVPFFTTKREGSGVGLALARQVMIAHGGAITVGEAAGGGARLTLTF